MLIELEDKIIDLIENLDKDRFIFSFLSLYPKVVITKLEKALYHRFADKQLDITFLINRKK